MTSTFDNGVVQLYQADARNLPLEDESIDCVVTSPPYWGLRAYAGVEPSVWGGDADHAHEWGEPIHGASQSGSLKGSTLDGTPPGSERRPTWETAFCARCGAWRGDLGLEPTPELYVEHLVAVFREVRRVLKPWGTAWLNLGDCYATGAGSVADHPGGGQQGARWAGRGVHTPENSGKAAPRLATAIGPMTQPNRMPIVGLKPKDLVMVPARVALALQQPYYTGRIRDERDRIWLAAMLDAEGCLFIHKRKAGQHNGQGYYRKHDNYGPGVEIANTSRDVVDRIMALVGKGSISTQGPDETGGRRKQTIYRWNLRTIECREFVRELYPHLVAKQQQARILIGCPSSGESAAAAHAGLMALHRTGTSDVDFPPPTPMLEPGWYLRSDIIWSKANPMPNSVSDRPTTSHEHLFLLTKAARYNYDAEAIREPSDPAQEAHNRRYAKPYAAFDETASEKQPGNQNSVGIHARPGPGGRNRRSVWEIPTQPYPDAHFATFPQALVEPCILAGTSERGVCPTCGKPWERVIEKGELREDPQREGRSVRNVGDLPMGADGYSPNGGTLGLVRDRVTTGWRPTCDHDEAEPVPATVLDPFVGSGTTAVVAQKLGRHAIGVDLSAKYLELAAKRIGAVSLPMVLP